jgi:hypothetical protein
MQLMEVVLSRFGQNWQCHLTNVWRNFAKKINTGPTPLCLPWPSSAMMPDNASPTSWENRGWQGMCVTLCFPISVHHSICTLQTLQGEFNWYWIRMVQKEKGIFKGTPFILYSVDWLLMWMLTQKYYIAQNRILICPILHAKIFTLKLIH